MKSYAFFPVVTGKVASPRSSGLEDLGEDRMIAFIVTKNVVSPQPLE